MAINNIGKKQLALQIAGIGSIPRFCAIGSGSGTFAPAVGSLYAEVLSLRKDYTIQTTGTDFQIGFQYDYGSVEMSGIQLKEFGVGIGSVVAESDLWNDEHFPNIEFDGTIELKVELNYEVF